jgi:hypothetical protein
MQAPRDMLKTFTPVRRIAALLFLGLSGVYVSLSPGSIAGQGYTGEEIDSGLRILAVATAWMKGHPAAPMVWSRHGLVSVLFDLPFLKLGKLVMSPDFMLSFQPAFITAALVTILFLWLRELCEPGMSLFLSLTAAFGTMLWPYAYISLETKQSLFVFLAGYLALAGGKIRSRPRLLFFAIACGLAMSVKTTGIILWPVTAYLIYAQFRGEWQEQRNRILVVALIIVAIWGLGHWTSNFFWGPRGGGGDNLRPWLIDSPVQLLSNVIGIFGSPTKGLLVYAPILIASLYAVPRAYHSHRDIVIYALLVVGCTVGLIALLASPTDEVWGCRYLHLAIAPLMLCIGAAWPRFTRRNATPLAILAIIGVAVSFLGAFYYYGVRDFAMQQAGQNTMEWITGDRVWNAVQFNAKLLRVWLWDSGTAPVLWTPQHIWVWTPPSDAPQWKTINLRDYCQPQSFMVHFWRVPKNGIVLRVFVAYVSSLVLGVLLLTWVVLRTVKEQRTGRVGEFSLDTKEAHAS